MSCVNDCMQSECACVFFLCVITLQIVRIAMIHAMSRNWGSTGETHVSKFTGRNGGGGRQHSLRDYGLEKSSARSF